MNEPAAAVIGGVTLIERLGKGGMGEVWRGERVGPGGVRRRVALKRMLPAAQADAMLRQRFLAEARTTARLEHPNIVQLIDFGDSPDLYLVLEYVDGPTLSRIMSGAADGLGTLPPAASLLIAAEAALALDYAHRRLDESGRPLGIVHRDISPPNILVSREGVVKVGDFGIARAADNVHRTEQGMAVGKLAYMAPEQALGEPMDGRADVFALAVVLWECLALLPLLPRDSPERTLDALARCEFPRVSEINRSVPPAVDAILARALSRDPSKRFSSAGRFEEALRGALRQLPPFGQRDLAAVVAALVPTDATPALAAPAPPSIMMEMPAGFVAPTGVAHAVAARPTLGAAQQAPGYSPPTGVAHAIAAQSRPGAAQPAPGFSPPTGLAQQPPPGFVPFGNAPFAQSTGAAHPMPPAPLAPSRAASERVGPTKAIATAAIIVLAIAGASAAVYLVVSNTTNTSSATSTPTPGTSVTPDASSLDLTSMAGGYAHVCQSAYLLVGLAGTATVTIAYPNPGAPPSVTVEVHTNSMRDPDLARCIQEYLWLSLLRVAAAAPSPTSVTVNF